MLDQKSEDDDFIDCAYINRLKNDFENFPREKSL
jgi:hypothetical protein